MKDYLNAQYEELVQLQEELYVDEANWAFAEATILDLDELPF